MNKMTLNAPNRPPALEKAELSNNVFIRKSAIYYILRPLKIKHNLKQSDLAIMISIKAYMLIHQVNTITQNKVYTYLKGTYQSGLIRLVLKRLQDSGLLCIVSSKPTSAGRVCHQWALTEKGNDILQEIEEVYYSRLREFIT